MADETDDATRTPIVLQLTPDELALICEALDSHIFWQLSDPQYRDDGNVRSPGSDVIEKATLIAEASALLSRLEPLLRDTPSDESS
jgi:hypothetical protein